MTGQLGVGSPGVLPLRVMALYDLASRVNAPLWLASRLWASHLSLGHQAKPFEADH